MIILDFKNINPDTCKLDYDEKQWTDGIHLGAFFGNQSFIVNEVDFSFDCGLLGFARELKAIAIGLQKGQSGILVDPQFQCLWEFRFDSKESKVTITAVKWKDPSITDGVAQTTLDELTITSTEYLDRVFLQCNLLCPKLGNSKLVQRWLQDLTLPAFSGFKSTKLSEER